MESEETRDPGTSETPTGVPPANDEPAQNADDELARDAEIDDQPQGDVDADAGQPEGGGASDADEEASETSETSETPETPETGGV